MYRKRWRGLPLTMLGLGTTIAASTVCANPLYAVISGLFFLFLQFFFSDASETAIFFLNIQNEVVQNAISISLLTSTASFLTYLALTFDNGSCFDTKVPLHQAIPLKIIFTITLLWRLIMPDVKVGPAQAVCLLMLFVITSACWVVAASSFENQSNWLWWPAIHSVVVDTGIYSVLLVHYASDSQL